jgi:hypothetical protein
MIYYDSPQAQVSWNEELKAVTLEFKGFAQGEQYRIPYEKGLELLVQKKAQKWLLNGQKASAIQPDDQAWIAQDFHPRNVASGLKYMAFVQSEKMLSKSSAKRTVSAALGVSEFTIETFDSLDEAIQWLSEIN